MKKQRLLKTLLVAVGLFTGVSAWAYEVPTGYEIKNVFFGTDNGDGTVTAEDFAATGTSGWSLIGFSSDANNSVAIADVTEVAKPEVGSAPAADTYPTYVSGKTLCLTARGRQDAIKYTGYSFASVSSGILVFDADIFGDGLYPTYIKFVDSDGADVLTMHWVNGNTNAARYFAYKIGTGDETNTSLGGKPRSYHGYGIRDFSVNLETGAVSFKLDYISFAGSRTISDAVALNIGTGKNIAGIQLGYSFNSGNSNTTQHSYMDNIKLYTVGVESPSYTYTITAKAGATELKTIATGSCKGGMAFSAEGIPYVIEKSGSYYVLTDAEVSNYMISYTMENDGSNKDQEVEYTLDNTIVYYAEAEDTENHGGVSNGNYSNGSAAPVTTGGKYSYLCDLPAAVYAVTGAVTDRPDRGMVFRKVNNTAAANYLAYVTTATAGIMSGEFILPTESPIYISGINSGSSVNQSATLDYIIIRKTADLPATETIKVTDAGMATYVSNYNLDFTGKTTKAYKVSVESAGVATLTELTKVPAKTPVLLVCDGGNGDGEAITITSDAIAAVTDNDLMAGTGAAVATEDGEGNTNMILNNVSGVGFYLANNQTVATNRAYLHFNSSLAPAAAAARMSIVFDGESTGINSVQGEGLKANGSETVYNLNGQRVAQPTKGLYIAGGKKVIVK